MKRHSMSRSGSRRDFSRKAVRVNRKNNLAPMRGGIRL